MNDSTTERVLITLTSDELGAIAALASCTHDANLPILTGIRVIVTDGRLVAYVTDRYRAARLTMHVTAEGNTDVVLPGKWLAGFYASAKKTKNAETHLAAEGNEISLSCVAAGLTLGTTTVYGQYPDLDKLFPVWSETPVTHAPINLNANLLASLAKLGLPADISLPAAKRSHVWRMQHTVKEDGKPSPVLFTQQSKDKDHWLEFMIQPVMLLR